MAGGGTYVTIAGTNFDNTLGLVQCSFSSVAVSATYNSATQIVCQTPAVAASAATVLVSNNAQNFAASSLSFTYHSTFADPVCATTKANMRVSVNLGYKLESMGRSNLGWHFRVCHGIRKLPDR